MAIIYRWSHAATGSYDKRSDLAAPMLIRDDLGSDLIHPATGQKTAAKSHFRQLTKASGCIEMGDQAPTEPAKPKLNKLSRADVQQALHKVKQGYKPN